jgi:Domain of unknown function (DUF5666)
MPVAFCMLRQDKVVHHTRVAITSLGIVVLWYQPLRILAQSQYPSNVRTSLKNTDPVDAGSVISRGPDSVTVKNELFTRIFRINAQTEIRRVDSSQLQVGDMVAIRCHLDDKGIAIADSIEANVDHWEGVITKVFRDTVYIKFETAAKGNARVIFDSTTEFGYCAGDDPKRACAFDDLKVGRFLDTVGFVLRKNELRAMRVLVIQSH